MRISDWSSDVCSSDLHAETRLHPEPRTLGVAQESDGGTDRAEVRRHRASERGARAGAPLRVHFRLAEQMDGAFAQRLVERGGDRSEEHTSELQSLMRNSYADFCFKKKTDTQLKCLINEKK